jgi:hypothetical protein
MSWDSGKQNYVALSTAEAKNITACDACTKTMRLRKLASGLFDRVLDSIMIYCDNQS